jgi:predicted DNA-binding transcriptional regulator AlpA
MRGTPSHYGRTTTALGESTLSIPERNCGADQPGPESMSSESDDVLLDVTEAAAFLRVSAETVKYLRSQRGFAPAIKIGRRVLWLRGDLVEWRNQQRERA